MSFNPQASLHLGVILFRDSETPIGVNAFGLIFEDGCYALGCEENDAMGAFHKEIITALIDGKTIGTFRGESWRYVGAESCQDIETINA